MDREHRHIFTEYVTARVDVQMKRSLRFMSHKMGVSEADLVRMSLEWLRQAKRVFFGKDVQNDESGVDDTHNI